MDLDVHDLSVAKPELVRGERMHGHTAALPVAVTRTNTSTRSSSTSK